MHCTCVIRTATSSPNPSLTSSFPSRGRQSRERSPCPRESLHGDGDHGDDDGRHGDDGGGGGLDGYGALGDAQFHRK